MHLSPYAQYRLIAASARDSERIKGGRRFLGVMEVILMIGSLGAAMMFVAVLAVLLGMAGII